MPINVNPPSADLQPFNVPAPAYTDPLQTLSQLGQMRTQGLQRQQAEMQLQQERMQMQSTQGLMKAYQEAGGDPDKMEKLAPQYGVLPDHMLAIKAKLDTMAKERAQTNLFGSEAAKNAAAARDQEHDQLNEAYGPVWDEKDPVKRQALGTQINQSLTGQGWDPKKLLTDFSDQGIAQARAAYTTQNWIKTEAERQEKEALTAKAKEETAAQKHQRFISDLQSAEQDPATGTPTPAATAALRKDYPEEKIPATLTKEYIQRVVGSAVPPEKQPEYQLKQRELELMNAYKGSPQSLQDRINQSIDPVKYPDLNRRALNEARNQASYEDLNKVIENYAKLASEQEKTIATETSPEVIKARTQQAVSTAQAVAPIETARSVATAVATEKAKAQLSPDVFNQIIDPASRNRAIAETEKYTKEYITKMNDAQKMLDTINAAQGGNQAASGLIPLEEVRSIVNRVTRQELESVSGGGSLLRRVENMLSQATSGKMSAAQLKDLRALGELQKEGAKRAYQGGRLSTKMIYGVMPPEVDLTGIVTPAGGAGAHVIQIGNKRYRYNGSGDTGDLKNYTEVK